MLEYYHLEHKENIDGKKRNFINKEQKFNIKIGLRGYGKYYHLCKKFYQYLDADINDYIRRKSQTPEYIVMNDFTLLKLKTYLGDIIYMPIIDNVLLELYGIKILTDNTLGDFCYKLVGEE